MVQPGGADIHFFGVIFPAFPIEVHGITNVNAGLNSEFLKLVAEARFQCQVIHYGFVVDWIGHVLEGLWVIKVKFFRTTIFNMIQGEIGFSIEPRIYLRHVCFNTYTGGPTILVSEVFEPIKIVVAGTCAIM